MESKLTGCCTFTKFLFIFFNIIFFLIGAAALGIGIWAQVSKEFTTQVYDVLKDTLKLDEAAIKDVLSPETIDNAAILIIVGGGIVMILGFLGCFGAMRESQCLLVTFFIFLFLILGIIVAGAILVLAFPTTVENNFKPEFKKIFDRWTADPNVNETIDFIQMELHCCGIDGSEDYTNANKTIPVSCREGNVLAGAVYAKGCLAAFGEKINDLLAHRPWMVGGIGIGVLAILVIGMILSCCLFCAVRKADDEYV